MDTSRMPTTDHGEDTPGDADAQARAYNTPDFSLDIPRGTHLGDTLPAKVGAPAREFEAARLDGTVFRLAEERGRRHVVLMMGSITSPMCAIAIPALNRLHADLGERGVAFYLVYTRESHPGERYPHHTSLAQKTAHARDLQRLEDVRFPILVDSLDGAIHCAYGLWPTSLFVVHRDGRLVYRSTIANPPELAQYLAQLLAEDALAAKPEVAPHVSYTECVVAHDVDEGAHYRVYERAGPKAFGDYWRTFPALRDRWPRPPE
jgi:hypothetical protein